VAGRLESLNNLQNRGVMTGAATRGEGLRHFTIRVKEPQGNRETLMGASGKALGFEAGGGHARPVREVRPDVSDYGRKNKKKEKTDLKKRLLEPQTLPSETRLRSSCSPPSRSWRRSDKKREAESSPRERVVQETW